MKSFVGWVLILATALFLGWSYVGVKREMKQRDEPGLQALRRFFLTWELPGRQKMIFALDKKEGSEAAQVEGRLQFDDVQGQVYRTVLVEEARRAVEDCDAAAVEADKWNKEIVTLQQSERGWLLARDEGFVREFDALVGQEFEPAKVALARWQAAKVALQRFESGDLVETGTLFAEADKNPFREMRAAARLTLESYRDARYRIEGMLEVAKNLPARSGKGTLLAAIEDVKRGKTLPRPATSCPPNQQTPVGCTGLTEEELKAVLLAARQAKEKKELGTTRQELSAVFK